MKKLLTIFMLALCAGAQARLNETVNECVQRYGNPSGMDEKKTTFYFAKEGVDIHITFDGGRCVKIVYQKQRRKDDGVLRTDFAEIEVLMLLAANSEGHWKRGPGLVDDDWVSERRDCFATHEGGTRRLVIMTHGWLLREWAERQQKVAAEQADKVAKAAAEQAKLKGF